MLQKKQFNETAEPTGDLIDNKVANKIAKKSSQNGEANNKIEVPKERYISPEKRQQHIDELKFMM